MNERMHLLITILIIVSVLVPLVIPKPALAECDYIEGANNPNTLIPVPNFKNPDCQTFAEVKLLLEHIVNRLIEFVLAIAIIFLIITGYQFVTSLGNKQGMEDAKRSLLYITIGILMVLGAFMIVRFFAEQFIKTP